MAQSASVNAMSLSRNVKKVQNYKKTMKTPSMKKLNKVTEN